MYSDEGADNLFRMHILGVVQILTFTLALCTLAVVYYGEPIKEMKVEKTKYVTKAEVETAQVSPKTLQAETQLTTLQGAQVPMYAVYGETDDSKRVWCATFIDIEEAQAWVQASKVFGRAVRGAVIADQKPAITEAANDTAVDETSKLN